MNEQVELKNYYGFCFRMLMPKRTRMCIYEQLFREGVMVARKDYRAPKHPELDTIQNLHVIKAMQVYCLDLNFTQLCRTCSIA